MTALWCVTSSLNRARYRTLSNVVTRIWLGGVSRLIGGADTTSSCHGFHLPLPCKTTNWYCRCCLIFCLWVQINLPPLWIYSQRRVLLLAMWKCMASQVLRYLEDNQESLWPGERISDIEITFQYIDNNIQNNRQTFAGNSFSNSPRNRISNLALLPLSSVAPRDQMHEKKNTP